VLLSDVITEQRQKLASQTNRNRNGYVGRIFSFHDRRPSVEAGPGTNLSEISMISPLAGSGIVGDTWIPNDNYIPHRIQPDLGGEEFLGWNSLDLQLWDSFPFMTELFIPMSTVCYGGYVLTLQCKLLNNQGSDYELTSCSPNRRPLRHHLHDLWSRWFHQEVCIRYLIPAGLHGRKPHRPTDV
jgi:hypothetical protein